MELTKSVSIYRLCRLPSRSFTFSQRLLQVNVGATRHDQPEQLQGGGVEVSGAHQGIQHTAGHGNPRGKW